MILDDRTLPRLSSPLRVACVTLTAGVLAWAPAVSLDEPRSEETPPAETAGASNANPFARSERPVPTTTRAPEGSDTSEGSDTPEGSRTSEDIFGGVETPAGETEPTEPFGSNSPFAEPTADVPEPADPFESSGITPPGIPSPRPPTPFQPSTDAPPQPVRPPEFANSGESGLGSGYAGGVPAPEPTSSPSVEARLERLERQLATIAAELRALRAGPRTPATTNPVMAPGARTPMRNESALEGGLPGMGGESGAMAGGSRGMLPSARAVPTERAAPTAPVIAPAPTRLGTGRIVSVVPNGPTQCLVIRERDEVTIRCFRGQDTVWHTRLRGTFEAPQVAVSKGKLVLRDARGGRVVGLDGKTGETIFDVNFGATSAGGGDDAGGGGLFGDTPSIDATEAYEAPVDAGGFGLPRSRRGSEDGFGDAYEGGGDAFNNSGRGASRREPRRPRR